MRTATTILLTAALLIAAAVSTVQACPFCEAPSLTLSEQLAQADAAVLVQWVEGTKPTDKLAGSTVYEVKQIVRNHKDTVKVGDRVTLRRYRSSKVGDLFMLMGSKGVSIDWGSPLEVTETGFNYISQAPSPEVPTTKRLEYFVRFLEYPDQMIGTDAYGEFANAPYKDITALGVDGLMSGYLLLTGEKGLDLIDKTKLSNRDVPFSETYAAMQALRFMWRYAEGRIEKERLRQSMRILLDRPELTDLVIADLARWKDWSVQDRLMSIYGEDPYNIPSIKRAVVRYLRSAQKTSRKTQLPAKTANCRNTSPKPVNTSQRCERRMQRRSTKRSGSSF